MITHNFNTLDLLTSPVWIVSPFEEQLIYANSAARLLMQDLTFSQLRTGPYSVSSQKELPKYLYDTYRWSMKMHPDYKLADEQPAKGYVRFHAPSINKSLQRWISVHWLPLGKSAADSVITESWMTATRNKIGSWFVDTVVTVPQYDRFERSEFAGYNALQYNGVWRTPSVKRPFGGAFRSFAFSDSATSRIYFIDLAVFFPEEQKKLKNLREQEAIARTFTSKEIKD